MATTGNEPSRSPALPTRHMSALFDGEINWRDAFISVLLACLYMMNSSGLIVFNKYIMNEDRFPFPVSLTMLHMGFASVLSFSLFKAQPAIFPSITDPEKKVEFSPKFWKIVVPLCAIFCTQVVLSNTALTVGSVAFLQMMKCGNCALVYFMSVLAFTERFSWWSVILVVCIVGATSLTIEGQIDFSMAAFLLQGSCQLFESLHLVLQQIAMSGHKLDAFSYVMVTCPICFLVLAVFALFVMFIPQSSLLALPHFSDVVEWAPVLCLNALTAFSLNVFLALLVKHTSAIGVILVCLLKNALVVLSGAVLLSEEVSGMQRMGFALQMVFIGVWSYRKATKRAESGDSDSRAPLAAAEAKLEAGSGEYGAVQKGEKAG